MNPIITPPSSFRAPPPKPVRKRILTEANDVELDVKESIQIQLDIDRQGRIIISNLDYSNDTESRLSIGDRITHINHESLNGISLDNARFIFFLYFYANYSMVKSSFII